MRELKDFSSRRWGIVLTWSLTFCTVSLPICAESTPLVMAGAAVFSINCKVAAGADQFQAVLSPVLPLASLRLRVWDAIDITA